MNASSFLALLCFAFHSTHGKFRSRVCCLVMCRVGSGRPIWEEINWIEWKDETKKHSTVAEDVRRNRMNGGQWLLGVLTYRIEFHWIRTVQSTCISCVLNKQSWFNTTLTPALLPNIFSVFYGTNSTRFWQTECNGIKNNKFEILCTIVSAIVFAIAS